MREQGTSTRTPREEASDERRGATVTGLFSSLRGLLNRPLASYYLLLTSSALLLAIGLVMVFSATMVKAYDDYGNAFNAIILQVSWALVGVVAFWLAQRLPAKTYRALSRPLLVLSLVIGLALMFFPDQGSETIGTDDRWIHIGPVQLQPSEFAKFALLLWVSDILVRLGGRIVSWKDLAFPLFPLTGLVLIVVGYSDLGTMLILVSIFMGLLWNSGVPLRFLGIIMSLALASSVILIFMEGRRMERLMSFRNSSDYSDTIGYQAVQGYYAIADGGWFGVGLGESRQKWDWLPNGHNDFILALIAEELGVVGCLIILGLFGLFLYTGFRIARRSDDEFRSLVAGGVTIWIGAQTFINIGGVLGLIPITGVPLPFISDGGTALVVVLGAVGMLAGFARAEPEAARTLRARNPSRWSRLLWAPLPPLPAEESRRH